MNIRIERARPEQAELLAAIQKKAFAEDLVRYWDDPSCPAHEPIEKLRAKIDASLYFSIWLEDALIGGAHVHPVSPGRHRLRRIYIDPDCQNRGCGTAVMILLEKEFPDARVWELDTPHRNYRNQHFYEKLGYQRVGENRLSNTLILFEYVKGER